MLTEILSQNPNDAFARYGLALEYSNAGDVDRALEEFGKLLASHPDYTAGYFMAAQALARADRVSEAMFPQSAPATPTRSRRWKECWRIWVSRGPLSRRDKKSNKLAVHSFASFILPASPTAASLARRSRGAAGIALPPGTSSRERSLPSSVCDNHSASRGLRAQL